MAAPQGAGNPVRRSKRRQEPDMKLTTQQRAGLQRLVAGGFARTKHGTLVTGVNTTVLFSLRQQGLITCTTIYLRGHVTADFTVTAAGRTVADADNPLKQVCEGCGEPTHAGPCK